MEYDKFRREYTAAGLTRTMLDACPLRQFEQWLEQAIEAQLNDPTAMALATVDESGAPWQRIGAQSVAPAATLDLVNSEIVMQLQTVTIQLWDDLNLAGAGSVTAIANQGIALEHNGHLLIDRVEGGSWVRLTG